MNNIIKDQLEMLSNLKFKVDDKYTDSIPDNFKEIVFFKNDIDLKTNELIIGNKYMVELANYIINEPPGFDLSKNWNAGVKPKSQLCTIIVKDIRGKMVLCETSDNLIKYGNLWFPLKSIKILN